MLMEEIIKNIQQSTAISSKYKQSFIKILKLCYNLNDSDMKITDKLISIPIRRLRFIKYDNDNLTLFNNKNILHILYGKTDYIKYFVSNVWYLSPHLHYVLKPLISTRYNDLKEKYTTIEKTIT
jgi:hypothetical protein